MRALAFAHTRHRRYKLYVYVVVVRITKTQIYTGDSPIEQQDTCSNEHEVCPMSLHKYEAQ